MKGPIGTLITASLVWFGALAFAGGPLLNLADPSVGVRREGMQLIVDAPGRSQLRIPIYHLPPGREVYSYTSQGNVDRWSRQGHIEGGELDYLRSGSDGMDVGGGVYVAQEPLSTKQYGEGKFVVFEMQSDMPILDLSKHDYKQFVWNAAVTERLRTNGVLGIGNFEENKWINLIHPWSVSKVRAGTMQDYYHSARFRQGAVPLETLLEIHQKYPLEPGAWVDQHYPGLVRMLRKQPLTEAERQAASTWLTSENQLKLQKMFPDPDCFVGIVRTVFR